MPARACVAARRLDAGVAFSNVIFRAVFVDGGVIDAAVCGDLAEQEGLSRQRFAALMADPCVDDELQATAAEAHRGGAFGAPTFLVAEHMFWGNDRLVLLRHHLLKRSGR